MLLHAQTHNVHVIKKNAFRIIATLMNENHKISIKFDDTRFAFSVPRLRVLTELFHVYESEMRQRVESKGQV